MPLPHQKHNLFEREILNEVAVKILAVVDEKPASIQSLEAALLVAERTRAELGVIAIRSGTHATEETPPVGVEIPAGERRAMPPGLRVLLGAADRLVAAGCLTPFTTIKLRDLPHGQLFFLLRANGERMPFSERYGALVEELNHEIDGAGYNLVVIASPRRGALGRFAPMNLPRRLALDLHCSFWIARGGSPDSRLVVCADGSPSSRRIFTLLQRLLPALPGPVDLLCARRPGDSAEQAETAEHYLAKAAQWLRRQGKPVRVLTPEGKKRAELILSAAGADALIIMGESHMHDVRRRTLGSLPMKVMARAESSVILAKLANEPGEEVFEGV
jgi:nucleotide-binding universal stress UspA family protein